MKVRCRHATLKGWAIRNAAAILAEGGFRDFYVEAGGDIQSSGRNAAGKPWTVGIRNPFRADEIIKVVYPRGHGIATSGTYARGQHIYDPHHPGRPTDEIVSLTVIGPDVPVGDGAETGRPPSPPSAGTGICAGRSPLRPKGDYRGSYSRKNGSR